MHFTLGVSDRYRAEGVFFFTRLLSHIDIRDMSRALKCSSGGLLNALHTQQKQQRRESVSIVNERESSCTSRSSCCTWGGTAVRRARIRRQILPCAVVASSILSVQLKKCGTSF